MAGNVQHPQRRNGDQPQHHDGAEELADALRAVLLHPEQQEQHEQGDGNDVFLEGGRDHLQAFDRRQHRDGRGDHAIAIEQAGAEHPYQQHGMAQPGPVLHRLRGQREHGHQAALAVVVGAQHQRHVLERDDDGQRPEEDGQDAVDVVDGELHMAGTEHFLDRVQHAGADVSEHDADGAEDQRSQGGFAGVGMVLVHVYRTHCPTRLWLHRQRRAGYASFSLFGG